MRFAEIRGQEEAIGTLQRALSRQRVAHAYLFSGVSGVGKGLAALALARALNCETEADDACGHCLSCRKVSKEIHPDVSQLTLPSGKRLIPIDAVRKLERKVSAPAYEGRANVAIIDPADMMSEQAANALLKTLEEPRPGSFLILISNRATALLPTVRSRCQLVRFRPLPEAVLLEILEAQGVDRDRAAVVAALCGGSLTRASDYLDDDIEDRIRAVFALINGVGQNTPQLGLQIAEALRGDRTGALAVLDLLVLMLDEILWLRNTPHEHAGDRILVRRFGDLLTEASRRLSTRQTTDFIAAANRAADKVKYFGSNPQLAIEGMVMTMRTQAHALPGVG